MPAANILAISGLDPRVIQTLPLEISKFDFFSAVSV